MRDAIEPVAKATGVSFVGTVDSMQTTGSRADYQSEVRWAIYTPAARSTVIRYDVRTGKVRAMLSEPAYRKFREALPLAVQNANEGAQINRVDARNEIAISLMSSMPIAPFCTLPSVGPGVWMLSVDGPEFSSARRFLSRVGCPALDLMEIDGVKGVRAAIESSRGSAGTRFGTRTGWRVVAQESHSRLEKTVNRLES
jgi:hypothetical protein